MSNLTLYTSDDGQTQINLRVDANSVWLFQASKQNVSLHAKNIFDDGELSVDSVVKESLTTVSESQAVLFDKYGNCPASCWTIRQGLYLGAH